MQYNLLGGYKLLIKYVHHNPQSTPRINA